MGMIQFLVGLVYIKTKIQPNAAFEGLTTTERCEHIRQALFGVNNFIWLMMMLDHRRQPRSIRACCTVREVDKAWQVAHSPIYSRGKRATPLISLTTGSTGLRENLLGSAEDEAGNLSQVYGRSRAGMGRMCRRFHPRWIPHQHFLSSPHPLPLPPEHRCQVRLIESVNIFRDGL